MPYNRCIPKFTASGVSDRQVWNFTRNFFIPSYQIDSQGNYAPTGDPSDPCVITASGNYDLAFASDYLDWQTRAPNARFEKYLEWRQQYGTKAYANLPQHKRSEHVGHCWMPCPYSTDSSALRSELMWSKTNAPTLSGVDHGIYYMKTAAKGSVWGFECTYSGCPYFINTGGVLDGYGNVVSGTRYFYV